MYFKTSDNVNIYYEIDGMGTPLVMLNGLFGDTTSWNKQVGFFSKKYKCVRMDHRGIAKSDKALGEYSYDIHARDVYELINHLNIQKCYILGFCHGGITATTFAMNYPERVHAIIINGSQLIKTEKFNQLMVGWKSVIEHVELSVFFRAVLIPSLFANNFISENINMLDDLVECYCERVDKEFALKLLNSGVNYKLQYSDLSKIIVPALIMAGDEDAIVPHVVIENYSKYWNNSEYQCFKHCGHHPQVEVTEEYNNLVDDYLMRQNKKIVYQGVKTGMSNPC